MNKLFYAILILSFIALYGILWWAICELLGGF